MITPENEKNKANSTPTSIALIKVDVSGVGKPAEVLIEKISQAFGKIYEPYHLIRMAKAETKADLIKAVGKIEEEELRHRAIERMIGEETRHQKNIESITKKAIPLLDEKSDPSGISDDWIADYFSKARIVSDDEFQNMWAKILAGESNMPGTFSKRVLNLMSYISKEEAQKFENLLSFTVDFEGHKELMVINPHEKIYKDEGVNSDCIVDLTSLGLISLEYSSGFEYTLETKSEYLELKYFNEKINIYSKEDVLISIPAGIVTLTQLGIQISRICVPKKNDRFVHYIRSFLALNNYVVD